MYVRAWGDGSASNVLGRCEDWSLDSRAYSDNVYNPRNPRAGQEAEIEFPEALGTTSLANASVIKQNTLKWGEELSLSSYTYTLSFVCPCTYIQYTLKII